jgi:hypothetical protein
MRFPWDLFSKSRRVEPHAGAAAARAAQSERKSYAGPERRSGEDRRQPAPGQSPVGLRRSLTRFGRRKSDARPPSR